MLQLRKKHHFHLYRSLKSIKHSSIFKAKKMSTNNLGTLPTWTYYGQFLDKIINNISSPSGKFPCTEVLAYQAQPYIGQFGHADRELNSPMVNVKAGDHIRIQVLLELTPSTIGDSTFGGTLGFDIYSNGSRCTEIENINGIGQPTRRNGTYQYNYVYVKYGTIAQLRIDYIIPAQTVYDGFGDDGAGFVLDQLYTPTSIIPWIVCESNQPGSESAAMFIYNPIVQNLGPDSPTPPTCPTGYHWDNTVNACVINPPNTLILTFVAPEGGNISFTDLTTGASGTTGSNPINYAFSLGDQIQINATPNVGYVLTNIVVGNQAITQNPYNFSITGSQNYTITAYFQTQTVIPPSPTSGYCWVLRAIGYTDVQIEAIRAKVHAIFAENEVDAISALYQKYGQDWATLLKQEPDLTAFAKAVMDKYLVILGL